MKKAISIGAISLASLIVSCGGFDLQQKEEQDQTNQALSDTMSSNKMMGVDKSIFTPFKIPKANDQQPIDMDAVGSVMDQASFGGMKALVSWKCSGGWTPDPPQDADGDSIYAHIKVDFQCQSTNPLLPVESKGTVSFVDYNDNGVPSAWKGCSGTYDPNNPTQSPCTRSPINTTISVGGVTRTLQKTFDVDTTYDQNTKTVTFTKLYFEMVLKENNKQVFKAVFDNPGNLTFQLTKDCKQEGPEPGCYRIIMDDGIWNGSVNATITDSKGNTLQCTATAKDINVVNDDPVSGSATFSCQCPNNQSDSLKSLTISHSNAYNGTVTWELCNGQKGQGNFNK